LLPAGSGRAWGAARRPGGQAGLAGIGFKWGKLACLRRQRLRGIGALLPMGGAKAGLGKIRYHLGRCMNCSA